MFFNLFLELSLPYSFEPHLVFCDLLVDLNQRYEKEKCEILKNLRKRNEEKVGTILMEDNMPDKSPWLSDTTFAP